MSKYIPRKIDFTWTKDIRNSIFVLIGVLLIMLFAISQALVSYDKKTPASKALHSQVREKIDPNSAGIGSLRRVPGIGQGRAEMIIKYRNSIAPARLEKLSDLCKIRGIGKKTARKMRDYLSLSDDLD